MTTRLISKPIILLGAPRSGTTMLFNVLSGHPDLWSVYGESQFIMDRFFPVTMKAGSSEFVSGEGLARETLESLEKTFFDSVGKVKAGQFELSRTTSAFMRTRLGRGMLSVPGISKLRLSMVFRRIGHRKKQEPLRIVEKTPENCFRIQLLTKVFDDALFLHIVRDPLPTIASIYTGWTHSKEFRRFQFPPWYSLGGYASSSWCFGLLPEWESLNGAPLIEVCARQWVEYNRLCRRDLPDDPERVLRIAYEDLVRQPGAVMDQIADWSSLDYEAFSTFRDTMPVVNTASKPRSDKWRALESELADVEDIIRDEARQLGYGI